MRENEVKKLTEGVIINTNIDDLQRHKMARQRILNEKRLENRVDHLEDEVAALKRIIQELFSKVQ